MELIKLTVGTVRFHLIYLALKITDIPLPFSVWRSLSNMAFFSPYSSTSSYKSFFFVHNLFGLFVSKLLFRQVFHSRPQLIDLLRSLLSGCGFFASAISSVKKKRLVLPDFTVIIKLVKVYTFSTEETDIYEDYTAFAQRKLGCNTPSLVNVNMIMLAISFIQKKLYQITF